MTVQTVSKKVTLDTPVQQGKKSHAEITLRKPRAGEMRGLTLTDVLNMDVNALATLLPRITTPILTKDDVLNLDPADLVQLGSEVAGFLVPKKLQLDQDTTTSEASLIA